MPLSLVPQVLFIVLGFKATHDVTRDGKRTVSQPTLGEPSFVRKS